MGQIVLTDVDVTLGGITIPSNGVKSVTINFTPEMKDNTGMGMTAKSRMKGLDDWSIDIEIFQDYADDQLDEDLWTLAKDGTTVGAIAIKPTSAAVGVNNPSYQSTAGIIESYQPIAAGSVGEHGTVRLRILAMGAKITREVA